MPHSQNYIAFVNSADLETVAGYSLHPSLETQYCHQKNTNRKISLLTSYKLVETDITQTCSNAKSTSLLS